MARPNRLDVSTIAPSRASLYCHSTGSNTSVQAIDATVQRLSAIALKLNYRVQGDIHALRVPDTVTAARRDGLWQHTCAELFIAVPHQEAYFEFNFAPSTEWAAYEFSAYRQQGVRATEFDAPMIACQQGEQELLLQVDIKIPALAQSERWQLGLSMVIEDAQGRLSYWALSHAGERPDFHRRESFVLDI